MQATCRDTHNVMLKATRLSDPGRRRKHGPETEGASAVEKTSMRMKDHTRKVPKPVVILVKLNGDEVRALIDMGLMANFISMTITEQLKLKKETYLKLLGVQLAIHGLGSKINCGARAKFQYQSIDCERRFDIANINNYDVIVGTPFMYQHKVAVRLNPPCIVIGANEPVAMNGPDVFTIRSVAADLFEDKVG